MKSLRNSTWSKEHIRIFIGDDSVTIEITDFA